MHQGDTLPGMIQVCEACMACLMGTTLQCHSMVCTDVSMCHARKSWCAMQYCSAVRLLIQCCPKLHLYAVGDVKQANLLAAHEDIM